MKKKIKFLNKITLIVLFIFLPTIVCFGQNDADTPMSVGGLLLLILLVWLLLRKSSSEIKYRCDNPRCNAIISKKSWDASGCCPRCGTEFYTEVK